MTGKLPIVLVVGPTATGKTRLAVHLAKKFDGEVVSADSMQVYKGLSVGTAKPTEDQMQGVAHHLMDFLEPCENFSVADFVSLAKPCVFEITSRGKLPIVVGGTGLYVSSFLQDIDFNEANEKKEPGSGYGGWRLPEIFERLENAALWHELAKVDKQAAERIHANDRLRVARALQFFYEAGETISQRIWRSRQKKSPYEPLILGLCYEDRSELYGVINARVDRMMREGLLDEAKGALASGLSRSARGAIGYKEFEPFFLGECTLEEAVENLKRESRRYAKRQMTWFRRDERIRWLAVDKLPWGALRECAEREILGFKMAR